MKIPIAFPALLAFLLAGLFCLPSSALSDAQRSSISADCDHIKQVLRGIQREDSRDRVSIGAVYETISSRYLTPLNLRLVNNNIGSPELVSIQSDFAVHRNDFSSAFIAYSRQLEELIALNCHSDPELFYAKLEATRQQRALIQQPLAQLNRDAVSVISATVEVQNDLQPGPINPQEDL